MAQTRSLEVGGKPVAAGKVPLICTPVVGRTEPAVLAETAAVLSKKPDLLEWRVDFFEGIGRTGEVVDLARKIRLAAGGVPIIFTRRSAMEGGEPTHITEAQVIDLYGAICESRTVDFVDYELANPSESVRAVRAASRRHGVGMIMSFHDFKRTPPLDEILGKFKHAERSGADVAKVAAMPQGLEDVLAVLSATLKASREVGIPLISMSMGPYGSVSRMLGGLFGSAVSFAVGKSASAPGQIPVDDLRTVLAIIDRALGDSRR
jgi:3-dehydroquinate dehydratase I